MISILYRSTGLPLLALLCALLQPDEFGPSVLAAESTSDDALAVPIGNQATPVERIKAADGFQVELLYSVPSETQGSWVNLCTDPSGRILVSDQFGGMYRFRPPAPGKTLNASDVQPVPAPIRAVNGMAWIGDALYVGVNDYEQKISSGLYRVTDSDGDDQLDKVQLLRSFDARGDHGVHAVVPSPDGKSLFLVTGNSTKLTELAETSPVPRVWGEDHLLPSFPDGRGHNRGVLAPGGIIYRVDLDGTRFEAYANGFRNIFDAAFDRNGELFTYDADMEYDFNTPWYRPTRICHVVSGAEFGWRNGAGKRPPFYEDNLPPVLDIGPGSPTGMTFGYGAKFPAKYQQALYALDWSWGKLYAVHLTPDGSTYRATKEEFVTGAPLPITDAIVHPVDGAMYFTIGGRKVQSGLYRVTYVGDEPIGNPNELNVDDSGPASAREQRHRLESFHGRQDRDAVDVAWPFLDSPDRFIRFAARTALEHQPLEWWGDRALTEPDEQKRVTALLALARVAGTCPQHRTDASPPVDSRMRSKLIDAVLDIDMRKLDPTSQLILQRTLQIILNRFGRPDDGTVGRLIEKIDPLFPADSYELNWLLCETLAWLESPSVAAKAIALIESAPTQEEQMQYARSIRLLKTGWTNELRTAYFEWFLKAANYRGGASFEKFIEFIRDDAVASLSDSEKVALRSLLAKKPERKSALQNLGAIFDGRPETEWTLQELSRAASEGLKGRDFANGRKMFATAGCFACHRFDNQGGMTGPDLTSAGRRYSVHDLLDQILHPSKVINDQFSAVMVLTEDGRTHTGVIVNLGVRRDGDALVLNTDLTDPNQRVTIDRNTIEQLAVSKTSPMPTGLLNRMTKAEILDLVAYIISGGDPQHPVFGPGDVPGKADRSSVESNRPVGETPQFLAVDNGADRIDRPNVLMICIDDLNDWTGFLGGHPDAITPHMDALAKRSRVFANAHCAVPVCSASRVSVMSGLAATTHGSYELGPRYEELPALCNVPTIHRYFKDHGYVTMSGGKVLHHGFGGRLAGDIDRSFGRKKNPTPGKAVNRPDHWSKAWDWGRFPESDEAMGDFQLAMDAADALRESFDNPFFMSVGFFRPHVPLFVPGKWFDLYDADSLTLPKNPIEDLDDVPPNFLNINDYAVAPTHAEVMKYHKRRGLTHAYLASISFVDHCVGIVLDALESSPHADDTIVVLWSDHGFHLGEKQHWAKRTLWEESTRVPLLVAGSGIQPGQPCREPASLIDIYPTLLELCDLPTNSHLEGCSLVPQLNDPAMRREQPAITSSYYGNHAIRNRDWRLIVYEDGAEELYDHRADADEFKNRAGDLAYQSIHDQLIKWLPKNAAPEFKARSERDRVDGTRKR